MSKETILYYYRFWTSAGTISIVPDTGGRYKVMHQDEDLGSYPNPQSAADDVSGGHTFTPSNGVDFAELGIPPDIGEWEREVFARLSGFRRL